MSPAGDLAAFLAARYDEAEVKARYFLRNAQEVALSLQDPALLHRDVPGWDFWPEVEAMCAARLADIAAKRAILALHPHTADTLWACWICGFDAEEGRRDRKHWCKTVRHLGAEFAAHPKYEADWKP